MANVLLIKGQSQYSAMRNYIDEIETGFRMAGYHTCVLDGLDESFWFQFNQLQNSIKTDITFVCNAMLQTRVSDVYITYLTDHPASHRDRLTRLDERSVVFVCDRRHEAYVRKYCPNIRHVKYIPLSGEAVKQYIPYSRRSRDLVFTGSYRKPEEAYRDIFYVMKASVKLPGIWQRALLKIHSRIWKCACRTVWSFLIQRLPVNAFMNWLLISVRWTDMPGVITGTE